MIRQIIPVALCLFLPLTTLAQVNTWTGAGTGDLWTTGGNWSQGSELDGADTGGGFLGSAGGGVSTLDAPYSRGQLYTVVVHQGHTVTQNGGYLQTRGTGHHVYIGDDATGGTWIVNGGDLETQANSIRLGRFDGSHGTLVQNGGDVHVRGSLFVGGGGGNFGTSTGTATSSGSGTYLLQSGTLRDSTGASYFGYNAGSTGYFEQTGGTAILSGATLAIGRAGSGTYVLTNGQITNSRPIYLGTASGGAGTFNMSGGTFDNTNFLQVGNANGATGHFELSGGNLNFPTSGFRIGEAGDGTVNQTGGTVTVSAGGIPLGITGTGDGVYNISAGNIVHTGGSPILVGEAGRGTFNISGTADIDSTGTIHLGRAGGTGTVNQTAGTVSAGSVVIDSAGSEFNLDGGSLTTDSIAVNSGAFNWGAATLSTRSSGNEGVTDTFTSPGFTEVRVGTELDVTGSIASSANGSTLDLGSLFINSGTRFNQVTVTGSLDLSQTDALVFNINPYLLRPNIGLVEETGSLVLVDAAGGFNGGTFNSFSGVVQDSIGWTEYTGAFSSVNDLPTNSWYLEQTGTQVLFHFNVEGTVPEPGVTGLALLGCLVIYRMRRKIARAPAGAGHGAASPSPLSFYE